MNVYKSAYAQAHVFVRQQIRIREIAIEKLEGVVAFEQSIKQHKMALLAYKDVENFLYAVLHTELKKKENQNGIKRIGKHISAVWARITAANDRRSSESSQAIYKLWLVRE